MTNKCTCGRSPTGNCVGWHKLSEEDYKKKKELIYILGVIVLVPSNLSLELFFIQIKISTIYFNTFNLYL